MSELTFVPWESSNGQNWHVMTPDKNYVLLGQIDKGEADIGFEVRFREERIGITCNELDSDNPRSYRSEVADLLKSFDPAKRYIEVGAGLGGFIREGITIIDPANYKLMAKLIEVALSNVKNRTHVQRLEELSGRCELVLDNSKVKLINRTLGEALREYPDLSEKAEVVIDNDGPINYWKNEGCTNHQEIIDMEMRLLTEGGFLYLSQRFPVYQKKGGEIVEIK